MTARTVAMLAHADARLVWRDPLLRWILLLPAGLALLLRILIPRVHDALLESTGFEAAPYYPLVLGGYLMTASGVVGMVVGFLWLDERDARTLTALRVTPLSMRRYLAFRVTVPLLVATASTLIGYSLIGIAPVPFSALLGISAVAALSAPLLALVLATAAPNKVAGLAVVKVLNGVNLLPVAAFFLPTPLQYAAGIIPTYWPMRAFWSAAAGDGYLAYLAIGAAVGALSLVPAVVMFERALAREA
jgi:fluoroquinolone transport system permease protein